MIKILVINDTNDISQDLFNNIAGLNAVDNMLTVKPGLDCLAAIEKYNPELILSTPHIAKLLNNAYMGRNITENTRTKIRSSTHQGVQLLAVEDVIFFQAEDKYVTAHYINGELLIEDSIASLEKEFSASFVRIHRKSLVKISAIKSLIKNAEGKFVVQLVDYDLELEVSRRQLPKVRKILLCN